MFDASFTLTVCRTSLHIALTVREDHTKNTLVDRLGPGARHERAMKIEDTLVLVGLLSTQMKAEVG